MNKSGNYTVFSIFFSFIIAGSAYGEGKFPVHYVHFEAGQILVGIPPGETVSPSDHFTLSGRSGNSICYIYPFEILKGSFWSQPLTRGVLRRAVTGSLARRVTLDERTGKTLRMEGRREARYLAEDQNRRRMSILLKEMNEGAESLDTLWGKLSSLRRRELALEEELRRIERHRGRRIYRIARDMEKRRGELAKLSEEKRELVERRRIVSRDPGRKGVGEAITDQIRTITKHIRDIRRDVARMRERKRRLSLEAGEAYRRLEGVTLEIRSVEWELEDVEVRMEKLGREIEDLAGEVRS